MLDDAANHGHDHTAGANARALTWALALTGTYMVAEVVGGIVYNSLALLSDAAHMLTDVAALAIALIAIRVGARPADERRTFGYRRFEVLAAAFNAALLFAVAIYVFVEAVRRFSNPEPVGSLGMLVVAAIGLVVNLVSMRLLSAGQARSLNVKGAYLEVWADMIGSLGVIGGALLIRWTGWTWVDPIVAVAIAIWVLPRTWTLLRDATNILLEGVPARLTLNSVRGAISAVPGVTSLHELHIWSMSQDDISLTAHVSVAPEAATDEVRKAIEAVVEREFDITHLAIQMETADANCQPGVPAHS